MDRLDRLDRRNLLGMACLLGTATASASLPGPGPGPNLAPASVPAPAPLPIRVAWDDYPPYQMAGPDGVAQGLDLLIAEAVLRQAGLQASWSRMPWARQLLSLQDGSLDLSLSASVVAERQAYALWTEPYRPERSALLALRQPARPPAHLRELAAQPGLRIGLVRGTAYPGEFSEAQQLPAFAQRLVPLRHVEQGLHMLRKGSLDYLIDDPVVLQYLARQHGMAALVVVRPLYDGASRLMLAKHAEQTQPGLLARLNAAIASLRDSGELRRLWASAPGLEG